MTGQADGHSVVSSHPAGSLALISDAGHMLTDAASLAPAIFAAGLASRWAAARC